jgi:hypothetical protein
VNPDSADDVVGFLCECGDESCTETLSLSLSLSRSRNTRPCEPNGRISLLRGHEILDVESPIHETDRFLVVQKFREEAAAVIETDPRS